MGVLRGRWTVWAIVAILTVFFTASASAQQVFGSIYGTITDASGAAVANAKITISDPAKGTSFELTTDASGNYRKGQLIPDTYKITIEAAGFQKVVSNDIVVEVDAQARFDAALKVGDVTTEVEVTAAAPLLQTASGDVSQTFTSKEVTELPNIGRNVQSMELLQPGSAKMGWQHASDENPQGSVQMVVDGQLFSAMGYELDGTTNQDPILGIIVINPTMDSLSEVKQALQNFDAEFNYGGRRRCLLLDEIRLERVSRRCLRIPAAQHARVYNLCQKSFLQPALCDLPPEPVRRFDRRANHQGQTFLLRRRAIEPAVAGRFDCHQRADSEESRWQFQRLAGLQPELPDLRSDNGQSADGVGRTPYHNNIIPTSQLSPQAQAIAKYFLPPNTQQIPDAPFVNNYAANGATAITGNAWNTREDYYINQKNTIFGRYSYAAYTEAAPGAFGEEAGGPAFVNYAGNSQALNQSLAIGWTDTISPTLINEFRFGWMKYHVFRRSERLRNHAGGGRRHSWPEPLTRPTRRACRISISRRLTTLTSSVTRWEPISATVP